MRARQWLVGLSSMLLWACGDSAATEPRSGETPEGDRGVTTLPPSAGGATGDFSGDCVCDAITRELALDEPDEVLGFTAEDVIARIEGEFVVPIVWSDDCEGAEGKAARGCEGTRPEFAGSTTEVRISIASAASEARVIECNRGSIPECHSINMYLPVEATLSSADGLLDEAFELELGAGSLADVGVGAQADAADIEGALSSEVSDFAGIEWRLNVTDAQAIFEVFVLTDTDGLARGHMVSKAPEGVAMPDGHSWGVAVDIEDARQ